MIKREVAEELTLQKIAIVGGLNANSNFGGKDGANKLKTAIEQVNTSFDEAIRTLYKTQAELDAEKIDWDDPFFAAVKRSQKKMELAQGQTPIDGRLVEYSDETPEFDQA